LGGISTAAMGAQDSQVGGKQVTIDKEAADVDMHTV
jgi:hypothetical protein